MKHYYMMLCLIITVGFSSISLASTTDVITLNLQGNVLNNKEFNEKAPKLYGPAKAKEFEKATLHWEGQLSGEDQWAIYSGTCGGVLLGTTTRNKFNVIPSQSQQAFFVKARGNDQEATECGSFEFDFYNSKDLALAFNKDYYSKSEENPRPINNAGINGRYRSFSQGLLINPLTGEVDLEKSQAGIYDIYFFPSISEVGYSITTLDIQNSAVLSIATTTQAAEDLTDGLFTITATAAPAVSVLVNISITGTATGGVDFATISNTFIFPAGQTIFDIPLDVIPDSALEGTETIIITLLSTNNTDVTIGAVDSSSMNLTDNDSASVNIADASGNEDDGAITITATLSNAVQGGFTVDLSTVDASATIADNDYTPIVNQTLIFNGRSGEVQTSTFFPTADIVLEGDETLIVTMSNLSATVLPVNITNSSIVTILNDEVDCSNASAISASFQTYDSGCIGGDSGAAAAVLFYDGFENALPTPNEYRDSVDPIPGLPQWRYEGAPSVNARLSVFSGGVFNRANNGSFGLGLDAGGFVPHSIILNLDLSQEIGSDDLRFSYASYNSNDENTIEDVVSIRGDITDSWVILSDWNDGIRGQWRTREADIDAVLAAAGQTVSANTEIRFTQSDNFQFTSDGVVFDDIAIFKEGYTYLWNNGETTGVIQDLAPGDYSVTVTSPEGCSILLNGTVGGAISDDASFSYTSSTFCQVDTNIVPTITGLAGGFFTSTPFGLTIDRFTGQIDALSSLIRTYTITYQTTGSCPNSFDQIVDIGISDDASFGYTANNYSLADPTQFPTFVFTPGGIFSSAPSGLTIDANTGAIEPFNSTLGTYTINYTTLGACPGTSSQQMVINNADVTPPNARCQPFVGQLDASGVLRIQAFNVDAGSTDNVGIATLAVSQDLFTCADVGVNNVTLTVTDTSGNSSTCDTTVTVQDDQSPILQCADVTLELDANGQASLNDGSSGTDYDVTATPVNIETLTNETTVALGDDQVSPNQPIGFDFDYFGNIYSNFRISSNGFIGFGGLTNNGCCQGGNLTAGIVNPANIIALAWTDLNPRGRTISFQTLGTAPDRKLVVSYLNTPSFGGSNFVTGQIHLFERTNRIEIHTASNNLNGPQTQGIVNADGSIGFPVPGRNAQRWSATSDAWAFKPSNIFATDNCELTSIIVSQLDFTCADIGVNNISLSATDASGNNSSCSFFVTVVDNELPAPDLANLPDVIASCQITSLTPPGVTDNCASPVNISNNASLPITRQGTTVVTWVYNDGNGNFSFQNQNIIIEDTTAPVADIANLPDVLADCDVTSLAVPTATEASCASGDVTINGVSDVTLPITPFGTTVVTWSYDDGNGNISTQSQNVIINDNIAPVGDVASLPALTAQCEITSLTTPTATDNCTTNVSITNDATLPITASGTITWTYGDGNGNSASQSQVVTINDTAAPVANLASLPDVQSACELTNLTAPTASDNCSSSVNVTSDASLPITFQGTTIVTWTYTDGNGNSSNQTQNVIVDDNVAPSFDTASLADVTSDCAVTNLTAPTATDNCAGVVVGTSSVSLPITSQGTLIVTWTYDDGNGNNSSQTQNVIVADATAPVPDAASLLAITSQCEVVSITAPTATDNCGGMITATSDATFPLTTGQTAVTWTYDDGNGNSTTQTQQVDVNDTTAPTPDLARLTDVISQCVVTTLVPPTATDNCNGTVTVTNDASLPLSAASSLITWTYDDGNGNSVTQSQNVLVNDTTAPTPDLVNLPDVTGQCEVTALTVPTATDNCSSIVTITNDAVLPLSAGTMLVTWTFDDGNGNTATQTQNVLVNDTTAPAPDLLSLPDVTGQCEVTALTIPTATDNCSTTVTITNDAVLPLSAGSTLVTWTYDDGNGNTATQNQNVIVSDDTPAVITCPGDVVESVAGSTYTILDYTGAVTATDNCSDASTLIITQSITAGTVVPVPSINTITMTVTDENGNDQTCSFVVRVDNSASNMDADLNNLQITIEPNPTNGRLNITSDSEVIKSVQLIDFRGRLVKTWNVSSLNDTQINISEFESAIYFVRIQTEHSVVNKRVIRN
jgi:hypothetical protein